MFTHTTASHRSLRVTKTASALAMLAGLLVTSAAHAATIIATPGEQNTQSGENGCAATPCPTDKPHWLHYPELLGVALGAGYQVMQNGDGGAVLGCDAASKADAAGDSFCASSKYSDSIKGPPNIAIIGPFGEHDQRILVKGQNDAKYDNQAAFEAAYDALVQDYLKLNAKVLMMTPIDIPLSADPLPGNKDLVKDVMLPAALKVAQNHNLKVVDTYTAISGTPQLVQMYNGSDGQVNMAGQQKMADLILAALNDNSGGTGGSGGAGGTGGAAAGSGGTGGAAAGAGGAATGGVASGGVAGTVATAGASTTAGTGGAPSGASGTGPTGTSGTTTALGGTAPITTTAPSSDSGGCSLSSTNGAGWGAGLALLGLALGALGRRRRQ